MTCIITKVSFNDDDHDEVKDWIDEMEEWKKNLSKEISQKYSGAKPTIQAISQDLSKPKREENKEGTE